MNDLFERLVYSTEIRAQARTEATAAIQMHGNEAARRIQDRIAKLGRTRYSRRVLRLALQIVRR